MTWFRIQEAHRNPADLLDPEQQQSHAWGCDDVRDGISVCETRDDLARYLAGTGIPIGAGEWVVVELAGDRLPVQGLDAALGEVLIRPTAIVAVTPADDDFYALVGTYWEEQQQ